MAQFFEIHPEHPQPRLICQAAEILRHGGLIAVPTECAYSLVGLTGNADVLDRIRRIRGVDDRHHFTLMCRDLSEIATYARVDNAQYRLLKATTPGPYTFILDEDEPLDEADEIRSRLEKLLDLVIDAGRCGREATTVVDLSSGAPELLRAGKGALAPLGL